MVGDWIQTYTGKQFWPLDPKIDDIDIKDIAHSLSLICRFTGHCECFYSVAEHSIRVCDILPDNLKLYGLLHDASEAYLSDISRPLKYLDCFSEYRLIEFNLMKIIYSKFGLSENEPIEIKNADRILALTEARDLMKIPPAKWNYKECDLLKEKITPLDNITAEKVFLNYFYKLTA